MLSLILTGQNAENNLEMPGQGEICKKKFFYTKLPGKDETLPTVVFARSSRIYDHF